MADTEPDDNLERFQEFFEATKGVEMTGFDEFMQRAREMSLETPRLRLASDPKFREAVERRIQAGLDSGEFYIVDGQLFRAKDLEDPLNSTIHTTETVLPILKKAKPCDT